MAPSVVYRFEMYALDAGRKRLARDGIDLNLPDACVAILELLLSRRGQIVSKDDLGSAGWGRDSAIGGNSVHRAISTLCAKIGDQWIETVARRGYRFRGTIVVDTSTEPIDPLECLASYRTIVTANSLIDTLDCQAQLRAAQMCRSVIAADPTNADAHMALATAEALTYESTRIDIAPARDTLTSAVGNARQAQRLKPSSAEGWGTLAFVLALMGATADGIAAARRAIELDPRNWRNHVRLAYVSWGDARRQAACQVMQLCPGLALAHWLVATVFIARGAFTEAIAELRLGAALQDSQNLELGRFNAVGLHLRLGVALAACGLLDEALEEFRRELRAEIVGQIYARECAANTWYSMGAVLLRLGQRDEAADAFRRALERIPGHLLATIGLAKASAQPIPPLPPIGGAGNGDGVLAATVSLACQGEAARAAQFLTDVLSRTAPDPTAWLLPAEPLINVAANADCWSGALTMIANRAR